MSDHPSPSGVAIATAVVIVIAGVLSTGCGGDSADGLAVSGMVTLDGKPLEEGHVTLRPLGGGPAVSGATSGSTYRFDPTEGLTPGPHVVEIVAIRPTGKVIPHPDLPGETQPETRNIVPPRYSRNSPLAAGLVAGAENRFDFRLTTRSR